jgi:alpha-galactosidase
MLNVHDRRSGEDLYPVFAKRFAELDPSFEPLTQRVYRAFGCFPIPGDSHLCEYLPWLSDPITKPWDKYRIQLYNWDKAEKMRGQGYEDIAKMGSGSMSIDPLKDSDSEGALEIITNVAGSGNHFHIAVNLPNHGQVENLPEGAMVETPGWVSGAGVKGVAVGKLPPGVAELCRRELEVVKFSVDAAVTGDRQTALQALLLDPVISDMDVAQQVLDDYLTTYKNYLPQFANS